MKKKSEAFDVDATALRDHGSSERVDRIWKRMEGELASAPERHRPALWWTPAAIVIVFGSGVFVGRHWFPAESRAQASLAAEPAAGVEHTPAAEPTAVAKELQPEPAKPKPHQALNAPLAEPVELSTPPLAADQSPLPLPAPPPPVVASGPPEWQRLADEGQFYPAWRALEQQGGFDAVFKSANADQLDALADVARGSGHQRQAMQALRQLVDRYTGHELAPLAAWRLGDMLEKSGDGAGAAAAFATYQRLCPKCEFAEDALGRQVDLALAAKDLEHGRKLVEQYAKEFPKGRRLREFRQQLAELAGKAPDPAAGANQSTPDPDESPSEESSEESPRSKR